MILDSNIIIYSAISSYPEVRRFIAEHSPAVSDISYVEVLGYHKLTEADRILFEAFFATATVLPITPVVIDRAVKLRQARSMSLGDSLIAATALVSGRELVTRNVADFSWVPGLEVINPFAT